MDFDQWLDRLADELSRNGVSPFYSRRLLDELQDHILDLQEADMNEDREVQDREVQDREVGKSFDCREQLGDPTQLAAQAAAQVYPTWSGRHPWLAFIAGAPILMLTCVAGFALVMVGFASLFEGQTVESVPALTAGCTWAGWILAFVPPIVATLLLCRFASRSGRRPVWGVVACGLVAFLAGCVMITLVPPQSEPGTGTLTVGIGLGAAYKLSQAIGPLFIGISFWIIQRRRTQPAALETPATAEPEPKALRTAA